MSISYYLLASSKLLFLFCIGELRNTYMNKLKYALLAMLLCSFFISCSFEQGTTYAFEASPVFNNQTEYYQYLYRRWHNEIPKFKQSYEDSLESVYRTDPKNRTYYKICDYIDIAKNHFILNDYRGALKFVDSAIALNTKFSDPFYIRGRIYQKLKLYDKAIKDFNKEIILDTNRGDISREYYRIGEIYFQRKNNFRKAAINYTKAINIDLTNHVYYSSRGDAYYNLRKYTKAIKDYNSAYRLAKLHGGKILRILIYRGDTYLHLKNYKKALDDYLLAEEIRPYDSEITVRIAGCYKFLNDKSNFQKYSNRVMEFKENENVFR